MSKNGSLIASEILVVDDEEDIRDLISGILRDEGYETRLAGDSDAALAAVRTRRPQLIILDIWLQGSRLDGIQVLDAFLEFQREAGVLTRENAEAVARVAGFLRQATARMMLPPAMAGGGAHAKRVKTPMEQP